MGGRRHWLYKVATILGALVVLIIYQLTIGAIQGRSIREAFGASTAAASGGYVHGKTMGAAVLDDAKCIRAILGEARGEGYAAMYAHACAIRNRGTLQGVYGATAKMEKISPELYHLASKAWYTSEDGHDAVKGATHWLSDYDKRHCRSFRQWINSYRAVHRVGTTTFYKEK